MIIRTSKIFINDTQNFINGKPQFKDSISGSLYTTLQDSSVPSDMFKMQYHLNTVRPSHEQLNEWSDRFVGSLSSHRQYAQLCTNVTVTTGNIVFADGSNVPKFKGCFIAIFNSDKIVFEVHYAALELFYVNDVIMQERNKHNQLETDLMFLKTGAASADSVFVQTSDLKKTAFRRKGAKVSLQDEEDILHALRMGTPANTQIKIASRFGVCQQTIGKLKKKFKEEGLL